MRVGLNPNKDKIIQESKCNHQVVIPVYIPNLVDYFENSFTILKICLESLFKTTSENVFITIVDNGSCEIVKKYLDELYYDKKINEIIHTTNIGKINSILKGIVGHSFHYITISDSDVLFLNNWQKETYTVFNNFKKAGVVGLTPIIRTSYILTANVFLSNFFSKKLSFSKIKNEEAMLMFYKSVGNEEGFVNIKDKRIFVLNHNNIKACVGCGHYVATYKSDVFESIKKNSQYKMSKGLRSHIDDKFLKKGYWRLNTHDNFAHHMGNNDEKWMFDTLNKLESENHNFETINNDFKHAKNLNFINDLVFNKMAFKLFEIIKFRRIFEKFKKNETI